MNKQDIAAKLVAARRGGQQAQMAWPDPAPALADAMEIQELAFQQFNSPSVGWKVGATNDTALKNFGLSEPFYGPMAEAGVLQSPAELKKTDCIGAVEPEFAFRMARDFPRGGEDVNAESALSAVETVHVAIEVIGRRVSSPEYQSGIGIIMDFAGNAAFIVGPPIENWQDRDLASIAVDAQVDGEVVESGAGANVLGSPVNSLAWMAKRLAEHGQTLKAGDWVSTGSSTIPVPAQAGKQVTAHFEDIGEVVVRFT